MRLGNFLSGVIAEWLRPPRKILNRTLHGAAGITLALVLYGLFTSIQSILFPSGYFNPLYKSLEFPQLSFSEFS